MDERDRRRVRARCSPDDVHGLDVAVDDAPLVEVHEAGDDAPHEGDDVVELKALLGHNLATQEASSTHRRISSTVGGCARPIRWESERTCISHMQRRPVIECNHGKLSRWSARKSEWRMRVRSRMRVITVRRSRSAMGMTMPPIKARLRGCRCRYTEVTGTGVKG